MPSLKLILNWSISSIYKARSKRQVWIILSAKIHLTVLKLAWISSDYLESLLLPQQRRCWQGENDSKQSDEIQAILKLALTQNIQESRGITCPFPVSSLTRVKTCLISMWRWTYQQLANIIIHLIETWTKLSAFARVRLSHSDWCHFRTRPVFEPLHRWSRISRNVASQFHGCVLVHCLVRKTENRWRKNLCQEKEN